MNRLASAQVTSRRYTVGAKRANKETSSKTTFCRARGRRSNGALWISMSQTVGRIFALSRNIFVGSYRFFNKAKRSRFEPYADFTRSSSSLIASSTALTYALGS
jgi:hypothetical protein